MRVKEQIWKNWSGSLSFTPGVLLHPESEEEISAIVKQANISHRKVRVVGAGHSSTPLVKTEDILISLKYFMEKISVLNLSEEEAVLKIVVFYEDDLPKSYGVKLRPKRLKITGSTI